jgi:hypothetical protein
LTQEPARCPLRAIRPGWLDFNGGLSMKFNLSAPTQVVFLISVVLAVLALLGLFVRIPFVSLYAFWVMTAAYVVLAIGCLLKGK